jgi:mannose-1-phosphate guanylyltransferase
MGRGELWGLVLAGGDGARLRDLTRALTGAPIPKQYCRLLSERSLLEATLARLAPAIPPSRTLVIVNRDHLPLARAQLRGVPEENVIVQPANRDTGPGMVLSLLHLARRRPAARLAVFPSDHWIGDGRPFLAHVARAGRIVDAAPEKIALLGIVPERIEAGFGYVEPAAPLAGPGAAFGVAAFHEKPAPAHAARLIARGALWNSFVMVFELERMLALLRRLRPGDVGPLRALVDRPAALAAVYPTFPPTLPAWNFSRDFLARSPGDLAVVRADGLAWSDWGTPQAIARTVARLEEPPWWSPGLVAALAAAHPAAVAL